MDPARAKGEKVPKLRVPKPPQPGQFNNPAKGRPGPVAPGCQAPPAPGNKPATTGRVPQVKGFKPPSVSARPFLAQNATKEGFLATAGLPGIPSGGMLLLPGRIGRH